VDAALPVASGAPVGGGLVSALSHTSSAVACGELGPALPVASRALGDAKLPPSAPSASPPVVPRSLPVFALASANNWSSQPAVTTTSLFSGTRNSPRACRSPWLIAAGNPMLVEFATTVTGTGDASCTPAR